MKSGMTRPVFPIRRIRQRFKDRPFRHLRDNLADGLHGRDGQVAAGNSRHNRAALFIQLNDSHETDPDVELKRFAFEFVAQMGCESDSALRPATLGRGHLQRWSARRK